MTGYSISRLAAAAGVGVETVRFYQRKALLSRPPHRDSTVRSVTHRYDEADLRRLRFIRSAQKAGFTLSEIGELLLLDASTDRAHIRDIASKRIAALDEQIGHLQSARAALQKLSKECAEGSPGPCPIVQAFEH